MSADAPYPKVDPKPDFPAIEREVLAYWGARDTFRKSVAQRPAGENGANEYVFYDGPPFANGLPHYGHILTGYAKDIVPRYQTMRGRRVERRFGWDCHGLPAEMEAEKALGVSGRKAILAYGIDRYNAYCRESVLRYTREWEQYVTRMARWVDFANDYKTLDLPYMESVMWAFKQLWEKGLIYEGYRVTPYSWALETPLSNFEIRLDDATRPKQDPAVTVAVRLAHRDGDPGPLDLLVWTTTPWTLPSNLGIAVGPDLAYALVRRDDRIYVLGEETLPAYEKEFADAERVGTVYGRDLVGRAYEPIFPFFQGHPGAHRVFGADFVETGDGTGVVHMAPYGEDDQKLLEANDVVLVDPMDPQGRFTAPVDDYAGQHVFDANKPIIADLKARGVLLKHETIEHNYPHCWRTDTPIVYKPLRSWFVRVTDFRDRMVELNRGITWIPEAIRDGQFGKWLEGARDWSISRNRYWGSPIPVWRSDDPAYPRIDVYGSLDEIERDFGVRPTDLHRPFVDELTRPNPDDPTGRSTMRRVEEVLDCWFESGSMPYAQVHYPFENRDWFEDHFPGDFIVEYVPQTRGWFYTLMVLGTALFDRAPFKNCICHGILLAADGRKLSKKLGNYVEPDVTFETQGADALRWYLTASQLFRGGDLRVEDRAVTETVRLVLMPLWSAYAFFTLYANVDGVCAKTAVGSEDVLDRYVLAKTRALVEAVTGHMDALDLPGACAEVVAFSDALNNWYIRRSRPRFWAAAGASEGKQAAYDTLYTVLTTLCRVVAPLLPLVSEAIHRGLSGEESVHLTDWPDPAALPEDADLVRDMDRVREICSLAHRLREKHEKRTRLPLPALEIQGAGAQRLAARYGDLVRDEVNVKALRAEDGIADTQLFELAPDRRKLGPKLKQDLGKVLGAARALKLDVLPSGPVEVGGHVLQPDEYEVRLRSEAAGAIELLASRDLLVRLDVETTPALEAEGMANDFVRLVQSARKDADLQVTDRIELAVDAPGVVREAIAAHADHVKAQVLACDLTFAAATDGMHAFEGTIEGHPVPSGLRRAP